MLQTNRQTDTSTNNDKGRLKLSGRASRQRSEHSTRIVRLYAATIAIINC